MLSFPPAIPPANRSPRSLPSTGVCPREILCSESEVGDLLASLDVSKSSGQDGISARMLKVTAYSIAPTLTKLFNLLLQSNAIQSAWKKALAVPVPKNTGLTDPAIILSHFCQLSAKCLSAMCIELLWTTFTSITLLQQLNGGF